MNGSKTKVLFGAGLAVALVVGAVMVLKYRPANAAEKEAVQVAHNSGAENNPSTSNTLQVKVVKPAPGGLKRSTIQPASVEIFEIVELFTWVNGILTKQEVDIGSVIKKGQILAVIDAPDIVADRDHAAADLGKAKADVEQALARVDVAQADWQTAKERVKQREAEKVAAVAYLKYRKEEFKRYKELADAKAIDIRLVDEEADKHDAALSRKDATFAAEETAKSDVISKTARIKQTRADVVAARAQVKVAAAALAKAQVFVDYTQVIAPFDGIVTRRLYHNGAFIRTVDRGGQLPLLTVQKNDKVRVVVQIPDTDTPFLKEGDKAALSIFTLDAKPFMGTVSRIAKAEDRSARTMRVEVDLDNKDGVLYDGMYGEIKIDMKHMPKNALNIPSSCLTGDRIKGNEREVYVARGGKVHKLAVRVGFDNGIRVEILTGLNADDDVIIDQSNLLEGTPVEIVQSSSQPAGGQE